MKLSVALVLFLAQTIVCWGQSSAQVSGRQKRLSICASSIGRTAPIQILEYSLAGAVIDDSLSAHNAPYFSTLSKDFLSTYEDILRKSGPFQYAELSTLIAKKDDRRFALPEVVKENNLCGCIRVYAILGNKMGWNKNLDVSTQWEILSDSGAKYKIKTDAVSSETYGKFPNPENPNLKAPYLDLARENAERFALQLPELLKDTSCVRRVEQATQPSQP